MSSSGVGGSGSTSSNSSIFFIKLCHTRRPVLRHDMTFCNCEAQCVYMTLTRYNDDIPADASDVLLFCICDGLFVLLFFL